MSDITRLGFLHCTRAFFHCIDRWPRRKGREGTKHVLQQPTTVCTRGKRPSVVSKAMDALRTDNSNAGILINTGSVVVVFTGSGGAMIASGAGAVNATGGGAVTVNTAGAGSVNATLTAQGTVQYDSSSRCATADTFTFLGWTLTRSASGQVSRPTSNNMSIFVGLAVDAAVHVSHKKKRRNGFGRKSLRTLVNACAKRLVLCTRGATVAPANA